MRVLIISFLLGTCIVCGQDKAKNGALSNPNNSHATTKANGKSVPYITVNSSSVQSGDTTDATHNQTETNNKIERIEVVPQTDRWFKGYVIFTAIIALINFFVLVVVWLQRKEMQQQRGVMSGQLTAMQNQLSEMKTARQETVEQMKSAGQKTDALIQQATTQANALIRQAAAAEIASNAATEASKAALLNAQAVIKAERAWYCLENIQPPLLLPYDTVPSDQARKAHAMVTFTNYGNTPAKVTTAKFALMIGTTFEPPNIDAFFASADSLASDVIPSGLHGTYEADLVPEGVISSKQLAELYVQGKMLWVCGSVKYQDIFETGSANQHETRFCYIWEVRTNAPDPFWTPSGPPEYNRAT